MPDSNKSPEQFDRVHLEGEKAPPRPAAGKRALVASRYRANSPRNDRVAGARTQARAPTGAANENRREQHRADLRPHFDAMLGFSPGERKSAGPSDAPPPVVHAEKWKFRNVTVEVSMSPRDNTVAIQRGSGKLEFGTFKRSHMLRKAVDDEIAVTLVKGSLSREAFGGLKFYLGANAGVAKVTRGGSATLNLVEVKVGVKGDITKWLSRLGLDLGMKVQLKVEWKKGLEPEDLKRLRKLQQLSDKALDQTRDLKNAKQNAKTLKQRAKRARQRAKRLRRRLRKYRDSNAQRAELRKQWKQQRRIAKQVGAQHSAAKKASRQAARSMRRTMAQMNNVASQINSRVARSMAGTLFQSTAKSLFKALNALGIALTVLEVGHLLYEFWKGGKPTWWPEDDGGKGGDDSDGTDKRSNDESSGDTDPDDHHDQGDNARGDIKGNPDDDDASSTHADTAADNKGRGDNANADAGPDSAPAFDDPGGHRPLVSLHGHARRVVQALESDVGIAFGPRDLLLFNEAVPTDLSDSQAEALVALVAKLHRSQGPGSTSVADVLEQVRVGVDAVKRGIELDVIGDNAEGDDAVGSPNAQTPQPFEIRRTMRLNPIEQRILKWTVAEFTGGAVSAGAGSHAFALWVADYQVSHGLFVDGIAGPRTTMKRYEELGKTDSPVYKRAQHQRAIRTGGPHGGAGQPAPSGDTKAGELHHGESGGNGQDQDGGEHASGEQRPVANPSLPLPSMSAATVARWTRWDANRQRLVLSSIAKDAEGLQFTRQGLKIRIGASVVAFDAHNRAGPGQPALYEYEFTVTYHVTHPNGRTEVAHRSRSFVYSPPTTPGSVGEHTELGSGMDVQALFTKHNVVTLVQRGQEHVVVLTAKNIVVPFRGFRAAVVEVRDESRDPVVVDGKKQVAHALRIRLRPTEITDTPRLKNSEGQWESIAVDVPFEFRVAWLTDH